ncbi:SpaH/EbpB family LPXTG-anchored major pilin [Aedoeadaptatus pacaensis]|uniref:SpaH/EbpB family LPXTG-anchored major pilin n=1 Tax=Aedoeadaptatus pacaensis TaxID=1776390 RepID=UPI000838A725|nr:SpaH/EbpB family LPXTG-anchored major pilin [Peptoniphilus pacaensis]
MKRKNTLWSLVLALVMVLGVFAPLSALADNGREPGTKDITVNVHKILISKDALKAHDINKEYRPHEEIADIKTFFGDNKAKEIEGVYFVALKEDHEHYNDFADLTKDQQKTVVDGQPANMKGLTKANGQLELKLVSPGTYKIYEVKWLSEYDKANQDPATRRMLAESKAVPVVLKLPDHARTENGIADTIHVYPKNTEDTPNVVKKVVKKSRKVTVNDAGKKEIKEDTIDADAASFDKDEEHTWAIEATIPTGFKDYEVFKLTDVLKEALTYKKGQTVTVKVKEDGTNITLVKDTDYKLTEPTGDKGGTLSVELTKAGIKKLAGVEGKTLRVEFVTTINDSAVMSKNIPNGVELEYGHNPTNTGKKKPKEPKVYTGGKKFKKIDSGDNNKALQGAKFVVMRTVGEAPNTVNQCLVETNGKYSWKTVNSDKGTDLAKDTELKVIESGTNGLFEIKGLAYDRPNGTKYKLVEVKAPNKYSLLEDPIEFTVNDTSYYKDATIDAPVDADPQNVDNKKITIPQTGGMGTMIFMVAGLALMGGAFIAMRKRSAEQA